MSAAPRPRSPAAWLLGLVALQLAACTSVPSMRESDRGEMPPPPSRPKSQPSLEPLTQEFPNCWPTRGRASDGRRAFLGIQAATCVNAKGQSAAFVVGFSVRLDLDRSPAQIAGLQVGDEIMGLDACRLRSAGDLTIEIEGIPPGAATALAVRRKTQEFLVRVPSLSYTPSDPEQARRPRREPTSHCAALKLTAPS
jgi:hypothetical protein